MTTPILMGLAGTQVACTTILGDEFVIGGGETTAGGGGTGGSNVGGSGGAGGSGMCTPNQVSCQDDTTVLSCDQAGNPTTTACSGTTPVCVDGACVPCINDTRQCTDKVAQRCENNAWVDDETCTIDCDAGECLTVTSIGAGTAHTCVTLSNGTVRCWGYTNLELLFLCDVNDPAEPASFTPTPTEVPGLTDAKLVGSGNAHNCVVTEADTLKCWGWNGVGRLGDGSVMNQPLPIDIALEAKVAAFTVATLHTCAALVNGSTYCWGINEQGQIGNGVINAPLFYNTPQAVVGLGLPVAELSSASGNTCMRDSGSNAACWGDGSGNQLGFGQATSGSPIGIGGDGVDEIGVGEGHTCWRINGSVTCVGRNNSGQLGTGSTNAVTSPFSPNVSGVTRVALAGSRTCTIDSNDVLSCWGRNADGEVGIGTSGAGNNVTLPTAVDIGPVKEVALGYAHSCALTTEDRLFCWGANNHGQVGMGQETPVVSTPTEVVW